MWFNMGVPAVPLIAFSLTPCLPQTSEEELFGNVEHPPALEEFLEMLGDSVRLRGFSGSVNHHDSTRLSSVLHL